MLIGLNLRWLVFASLVLHTQSWVDMSDDFHRTFFEDCYGPRGNGTLVAMLIIAILMWYGWEHLGLDIGDTQLISNCQFGQVN